MSPSTFRFILSTTVDAGTVSLLIIEFKNEIGVGGNDPGVQGALSYRKIWCEDSLLSVRESCCCPSFILSIADPYIVVQGGVLTDSFIVQL
ncbi:hypothetical protein FRC03_004401 [Tulasnella sp. 419]|nr:hypothetical protein FRC03_004401 [Tulasnella sp. 419]